MTKSFFFATLLLVTFLPKASATTIVFSAAPTARLVKDSTNTTVADPNSLVLAGTFATPANPAFTLNNTLSLAANVTAAMAAGGWEQFGLDTVTGLQNPGVTNTLIVNGSGRVGGQVTDNNSGPTMATFFDNKPIYLWVFNASSIGAATEMGIFRATTATVPWTFAPNANGLGDSVTYSTTNAGAPVVQAIAGFGSTPAGQFKLTNDFNAGPPVPEPSTALFGAFTVLAAISSRQRRK